MTTNPSVQKLNWDEFVNECISSWKTPKFTIRYKTLGTIEASTVSVVNMGLLDRARAAGLPGIVISVCDYTREALALSVSRAINNVLSLEPELDLAKDTLPIGSPISLGSTVVEYLGVSDEDRYGKMLRYKQPSRKRSHKDIIKYYSLSKIPVMHRCIPGTSPTSETYGRLRDVTSEFSELPETVKHLRSRASAVKAPVALATSTSPYLNIPPTALNSASIKIAGKSMPISSCLTIGRFSGGEIKRSNDYPHIGSPSLVVASRNGEGIADLFDLYEYLDEGGLLDLIVIEAPSAECIDTMRGPLEDIINDYQIPIIIFCEEGILHRTSTFNELHFPVYIWGKSQLTNISGHPSAGSFSITRRERCAMSPVTKLMAVEDDGRLSKAAEVIYGLSDNRNKLSETEQLALLTLARVLGQVLRQTEMIGSDISLEFRKKIDASMAVLAGSEGNYSLTREEAAEVRQVAGLLRDLTAPNTILPKGSVAREAIIQAVRDAQHRVCLVVSAGVNEEAAVEYWRGVLEGEGLPSGYIRVITPRRFLKQDCTSDKEEVFVSGWFQRDEMERLIGSGLSSIYTVFMYRGVDSAELETQWYLNANRYWKSHHEAQKSKSKKSLSWININIPTEPSKPETSVARTRDESLGGLARNIERERAETYRAKWTGEEAYLGRPVWFTSGLCRWLRSHEDGGDSLIVVTDALDEGVGYSRKTVAGLQEGDIVLRTESDDDALDEACRTYGSHEATLLVARSWHKPIEKALETADPSTVKLKIRHAGCKRNLATIAKWIKDPMIIAPYEKDDIRIIGKALHSEFSENEIRNIMRAASIIRGERISSGRKLSREIAEAFVKDARKYGSLEKAERNFSCRHGDMGSVELLHVEYIGDPIMVPVGKFGWTLG